MTSERFQPEKLRTTKERLNRKGLKRVHSLRGLANYFSTLCVYVLEPFEPFEQPIPKVQCRNTYTQQKKTLKEALLLVLCANKTARDKVYCLKALKFGQLRICETSPSCLEYFHKAVLSTCSKSCSKSV